MSVAARKQADAIKKSRRDDMSVAAAARKQADAIRKSRRDDTLVELKVKS
jgi:hypothetical protein